jgi:hypothetical protein
MHYQETMATKNALVLRLLRGFAFGCVLLLAVSAQAQLKTYDSKYYVIQTDLEGDAVREASLRMTKMAEEYHARTADFSGVISQRLPFQLFKNKNDYYAAGGMPGSAGVFNGEKLMAIAGEETNLGTWHVVQHEGFHQFAHAVIRGDIPIWVNEGLAEYFGEAIWTGDGFQTGLIPAGRLKRVKETMNRPGGFLSIPSMMQLTHQAWNGKLKMSNYDQAWSMVYFLAHGDDGKYQKAFSGFMRDIGRGILWEKAWQNNFGDAVGFEEKWRAYWLNLPDRPTTSLYMKASVSALTSFLARGTASKQTFDNFDDFKKLLADGQVKIDNADWLPPSLAKEFLGVAEKRGQWSILAGKPTPKLVMLDEDGTRFVGSFTLRGKAVDRVSVDVDDLKPSLDQATKAYEDGEKSKARELLQAALRRNPLSPTVLDARKFLADHK